MSDEQQRQWFAALYKLRRREHSKRGWKFQWTDLMPTAIGGIVGLWMLPESGNLAEVTVGLLSGAAGGLLWHSVIAPSWRWIFTTPVEQHVEQALRIDDLETELRNALVNQASAANETVGTLISFHTEGAGIRGRIRGHGNKPWDKALKARAKDWEQRVITYLDLAAPYFRGRFISDIPRTPQVFQPRASEHVSNWGNFMDRRLDSLQSIVEQLATVS